MIWTKRKIYTKISRTKWFVENTGSWMEKQQCGWAKRPPLSCHREPVADRGGGGRRRTHQSWHSTMLALNRNIWEDCRGGRGTRKDTRSKFVNKKKRFELYTFFCLLWLLTFSLKVCIYMLHDPTTSICVRYRRHQFKIVWIGNQSIVLILWNNMLDSCTADYSQTSYKQNPFTFSPL